MQVIKSQRMDVRSFSCNTYVHLSLSLILLGASSCSTSG